MSSLPACAPERSPFTFRVVERRVDYAPPSVGHFFRLYIVRSDGLVVRCGLDPDHADLQCAALNAGSGQGWTDKQYRAEVDLRLHAHRAVALTDFGRGEWRIDVHGARGELFRAPRDQALAALSAERERVLAQLRTERGAA